MKILDTSMSQNNHPIKYPIISFLFAFLFNASALAVSSTPLCYLSNTVCIDNASNEDVELALNAVKKTYVFFAGLGFTEEYKIELFFEKAVRVEVGTGNFIRIYGKLGRDGNVYLTDWNEPWLTEQNAYGIEMSRDFYESIIIHELAHLIAEKIAARKIAITLSEYIAYVVQLFQMQPTIWN